MQLLLDSDDNQYPLVGINCLCTQRPTIYVDSGTSSAPALAPVPLDPDMPHHLEMFGWKRYSVHHWLTLTCRSHWDINVLMSTTTNTLHSVPGTFR